MQEKIQLEVESRDLRGKGPAKRMRRAGRVPAVLYGLDLEPVALSVGSKEMTRILVSTSARNQVMEVTVGGAKLPAMAVAWQVDPVKGNLLHVDLRRVDLTKMIRVNVPVVTVGIAPGVKDEGGMEEVLAREIEVECLPTSVPEKIEIDVSAMQAGDAVRVRDLPAGENYTIMLRADAMVLHIVPPKGETAETAEAEEVPVVVADKDKKDKEEE